MSEYLIKIIFGFGLFGILASTVNLIAGLMANRSRPKIKPASQIFQGHRNPPPTPIKEYKGRFAFEDDEHLMNEIDSLLYGKLFRYIIHHEHCFSLLDWTKESKSIYTKPYKEHKYYLKCGLIDEKGFLEIEMNENTNKLYLEFKNL